MGEGHPDRKSYDNVWNKIIEKEIGNFKEFYKGKLKIVDNAKEDIWNKYVYYNNFCKKNYMRYSGKKLDRHKVAACYIMAIVTVAPMRYDNDLDDGSELGLALNEYLAINVAFNLVRAFYIASLDAANIDSDEKKQLVEKFDNGIQIPECTNHGVYMDNFCSELYYSNLDGKLNVLSLAHELYLLELYTQVKA